MRDSRLCDKMCSVLQGRPRGCSPQNKWLHPGGAAKLDHREEQEFTLQAEEKGAEQCRWVERCEWMGDGELWNSLSDWEHRWGTPELTKWLGAQMGRSGTHQVAEGADHSLGGGGWHMVLRKDLTS